MNHPNNSTKSITRNSVSSLNTKELDLASLIIYIFITIIILFFESIYTLARGVNRGVLRKEILSKDSNLGFGLDINPPI